MQIQRYFSKKIQGEGCRFKTSDGVWWDITDIEHPIISIKGEITDDMVAHPENYKDEEGLFFMLATIDENGILRINDLNTVPLTDEQKENIEKLYNFINNKKEIISNIEPIIKTPTESLTECATNNTDTCTITYDCPTVEDSTKKCNLDMMKININNTCVSLSNGTQSCPVKSGVSYVTVTQGNVWYQDAKNACPEGTRLAKAAELKQMWNTVVDENTGKRLLETLCEGCSRESINLKFWADEQRTYSSTGNTMYYAFIIHNGLTSPYIGASTNTASNTRVVCVGN